MAFKRRALQVHPDKGGSKEAFHLVYEALETLADPAARKKYDNGLATGKSGNLLQPQPDGQTGRKKTSKKRGRSAASEAHPKPQKAERPKPKAQAAAGQARPESKAPQAPHSKQTKLLIKIRDLLKQLPRDVRNDVFTKQFSQKQRLILEKWMVDGSSRPQADPEAKLCTVAVGMTTLMEEPNARVFPSSRSCHSIAVPTLPATSDSRMQTSTTRKPKQDGKRKIQDKMKTTGKTIKKVRSTCGTISKDGKVSEKCYRARIWFDATDLYTRRGDLQTALEFLVILTSAKQRMQSHPTQTSFEQDLAEALEAAASEQGRTLADLQLRFAVTMTTSFFVAPGFQMHCPAVNSIEQLGKVRRILEPFRKYAGGRNLFRLYPPTHLQIAWEEFQSAVADAWESVGVDSAPFLRKIRTLNGASAPLRERGLQALERRHMASNDRNMHRPKSLREASCKPLELRERRHMALEDKNKHRPKALRQSTTEDLESKERWQMAKEDKNRHRPRRMRERCDNQLWERKQMAMHDKNKHRPPRLRVRLVRSHEEILASNLSLLKKLLLRWGKMLKREASLADKKRRKILRERRKVQQERRRSEVLSQKRQREEARMRTEWFRKRMRSDLTMDDIRTFRYAHIPAQNQKRPRPDCGFFCLRRNIGSPQFWRRAFGLLNTINGTILSNRLNMIHWPLDPVHACKSVVCGPNGRCLLFMLRCCFPCFLCRAIPKHGLDPSHCYRIYNTARNVL